VVNYGINFNEHQIILKVVEKITNTLQLEVQSFVIVHKAVGL
jgi:hypothetical protein